MARIDAITTTSLVLNFIQSCFLGYLAYREKVDQRLKEDLANDLKTERRERRKLRR